MIWVFDASPLIYLNMVGLGWIFEQLEGEKLIPGEVYKEVVTEGKVRGDADAIISEELVKKGVIKVITVESDFKELLKSLRMNYMKVNWRFLPWQRMKGAWRFWMKA